jgi:tRNA(Ile)-lysidine synthase
MTVKKTGISKVISYKTASPDKTIKKVLNTVEDFNMLKRGESVLISISGGPDSTFLVYVINSIKDDFNLKLYGFNLDHLTRNGQSTKDSIFVEELCERLGVKLIKEKIDVRKWCTEKKLSFQQGARILRLKLLLETAEKYNIDKIALGHNADDNLETFFMHMIRGAGLKGLSGIKPVSGKFIRPLINTFRKEILKYLIDNDISFCIDKTNEQNIYFRNRIRNVLLPFMRENFSTSIDKNLLKSIEILREENEFVSKFSEETFDKIANIEKKIPYLISIPIEKLIQLSLAVRRRIIIIGIEKIKGSPKDIRKVNIEDILSNCFIGGERKEIKLTEAIVFVKEGRYFYIYNFNEFKKILNLDEVSKEKLCKKYRFLFENPEEKFEMELTVGSKEIFKNLEIELHSEIIEGNIKALNYKRAGNTEAYVDYDKIKFPVLISCWNKSKGDRFFPLGMNEEKKIHDFFIDNKVPKSLRQSIPLFFDREKIIWIGKYRIDERVKIDSSTRKVLHIKIIDI